MTNSSASSSPTIGSLFSVPGINRGDETAGQWKALHDKLNKELKSVKTASLPELAPKIGELFDIPISDVLLSSWKKATEVQALLYKSKASPDETFFAGLAEHTIDSEHHPYIEITIKGQPIRKIEFVARLFLKLNSFVLKIQQGDIKEIQTGTCEIGGTLDYEGVRIAEKKFEKISLPGTVVVT
ncbi:MAG TPA: hypothetical protein VN937_25360 [Blastocatellia bacterium]|nr:hypothetical protein [Blastocatellia bacterium]